MMLSTDSYSRIPPSHYVAALLTLALRLSPCCKLRQDADWNVASQIWSFTWAAAWQLHAARGGSQVRYQPSTLACPDRLCLEFRIATPQLLAVQPGPVLSSSCLLVEYCWSQVMHNSLEVHSYNVMRVFVSLSISFVLKNVLGSLHRRHHVPFASPSHLSQQMFFSHWVRTVPRGLHKSNCSRYFIMQKYFCHWVIIVLIVRQFWKQKTRYLHNAVSFWLRGLFQLR